MAKPTSIFGPADVANELGVSPQSVSNYMSRYADTPRPTHITPDGRQFWSAAGVKSWRTWRAGMSAK